ncbi:MAG: carboxypeptidase-like regulatory domain-containing protein [Bacteroidota bacterium]
MKLRHLLLILTLGISTSLPAQQKCEYTVKGKVFDRKTNEPLPFVTVQLQNTTTGTNTDLDGSFTISNLCSKEVDLIFSHLGYKSFTHHHDAHHGEMKIFLSADEIMLDNLIVETDKITGDLSTITTSKLSGKDYEKFGSASFADAVSNITGVNMLSTGQNIAKPIIHGLHSNRVLIVNSGVRHEFQNWGTDHAPEIDPSLYNSLEVIKGAGTVRYGPDALGGVILINPPELELNKPLNGEVGAKYRTNGNAYENNIKLQRGFNRLSIQGQASFVKQGDLSAPDYLLSNTGKEELSYAFSGRYHLPEIDFQVDYSRFKQDLGILRGSITRNLNDLATAIEREVPSPTSDFTYELNNPRQQVKHDFLKVSGIINRNGQNINLKYGYQKNFRREFDVRRGTLNARPSINLELTTHSFDADWKKSSSNGLSSVIGSQFLIQQNRNIPGTSTAHFVPNYELYRGGLYLIESFERAQNTFELGARYDYQYISIVGRDQAQDLFRDELSFQNFTLTLGYNRKISREWNFSTNIGSAWRPPNVAELYAFGKHESSIEFGLWRYEFDENNEISTDNVLKAEDREISPEKGFKWIGSLTHFSSKFDTEITFFVNYIENFIVSRPRGITNTVRGAFPFYTFEQSDAMLFGADYSVKYNHTDRISSTVRGNYLWSKDLSNDAFFVGQPPGRWGYEMNIEIPTLKGSVSNLSVNANYTFTQFQAPQVVTVRSFVDGNVSVTPSTDAFDFLPPPDGYLLVDLYWRTEFKKFTGTFRIHNLLNTSYRSYTNTLRYFADDIGRNISISLDYRF